MKLRFIATSLLMVSLLSSCKQNELRSDIKEFVASFSLSSAIEAYKHAGYTSVKESFIDGKKTSENIILNFDVLDIENPTYNYQKITKTNDEEEQKEEKYIQKNEEKIYFFETNKEPIEYSTEDVEKLIIEFFYTKTMYEGTYHCNAMYYGDLVLETARDFQEFVTIDADNSLYVFYHLTKGRVEGKASSVEQYYSVNKLGMLVKNISNQSKGEDYIKQEINVFTL